MMQPFRLHDLPAPRLVIAAGAEWFRVGDLAPVIIETRIPLRRLLLALGEMKRKDPGSVLSVTAAFEAGWPGERMRAESASARVYMAIRRLRALGLEEVLLTTEDGYALSSLVRIST